LGIKILINYLIANSLNKKRICGTKNNAACL